MNGREMPGAIRLHAANRLELLADRLAAVVARPLADPLDRELIVVQSRGMERWIAMQLAKRLGSWANCRYPFPNSFAWEMFRLAFDSLPDAYPYNPDTMKWRLMELLPANVLRPGFEPLHRYLAEDPQGVKLYHLSGVIADLFDKYTIFRPKMLTAWESGKGCESSPWQPELWRMLVSLEQTRHRGTLLREFCRMITGKGPLPAAMPERISVFGIPSLPPYHVEILAALSRRTEVNLFLLNPCREYWFTISSARDKSRSALRNNPQLSLFAGENFENPLLASMGVQGRDFYGYLYDRFDPDEGSGGQFRRPEGNTLLGMIQSDILDLVDGTVARGRTLADCDNSLQVHSCHSPLREVEVLHDRLLEMFEKLPKLVPREILVMTPNIEKYAPYISAIFGEPRDELRRIPFSIADRTRTGASSLLRAFIQLIDLAESRCGASQVLDLLEHPAVSGRFGLDDRGLALVRRWVVESGIRWGVDADDRAAEGLPGFEENSWRAGFDRLLLGYAIQGDGRTGYRGIVPYEEMEGGDARLLGGLMEFTDLLFAFRRGRRAKRSPSAWAEILTGLIDSFFLAEGEHESGRLSLSAAINDLRTVGATGYSGAISLAVVRSWLVNRLDRDSAGPGFLTGGVTFCAMLPMRSIPFRVIALLGMDDTVFPRRDSPSAFDLMAAFPEPCDRSMRNEDRYLFLEAVLSARDLLHISYVGQSSRDNSIIPPSVLVSELLDYAERSCSPSDDLRQVVRTRLLHIHHLQPFHPDYFSQGTPFFSYSEENCRAALSRTIAASTGGFLGGLPLSPVSTSDRRVTLAQLASFLRSPAGHFLRNRLGIRPERIAAPMIDKEPFAADPLDEYQLSALIVEELISGGDMDRLSSAIRAKGILPPSAPGEVFFERIREKGELFATSLAPFLTEELLEPLSLDTVVAGCRLTGSISGIRFDRMVRYRCAKRKAKDLLDCWLAHLALNLAAPDTYPRESMLIALDGAWRFMPIDEPEPVMAELIELYHQGLSEPLMFFPEVSHVFSEHPEKPDKAAAAWTGSDWGGHAHAGERDRDPANALCFGTISSEELLGSAQFKRLATAVYGPLLKALRKGEA